MLDIGLIIGGYSLAILMGFTLGLLGGGGSILAVPIFIYVFNYSPLEATSFSLFVVSIAAAMGFLRQLQAGNVNIKLGLLFSLPSLATVLLVRRFLIPLIPEELFYIGQFLVGRNTLILFSFASVMLIAGLKMIRQHKTIQTDSLSPSKFEIVQKGSFIGLITGFVGAGGGFLIVPALNIFFNLPIRVAMGTSLLVIMINSLFGFLGALNLVEEAPWPFLIAFSCLSIVGILIGSHFNSKVDVKKLKQGFGYFVVTIAVFILVGKLA